MRARLEFKGGNKLKGSLRFYDDLDHDYFWEISTRMGELRSDGVFHSYSAALEDFKRYGTILESEHEK